MAEQTAKIVHKGSPVFNSPHVLACEMTVEWLVGISPSPRVVPKPGCYVSVFRTSGTATLRYAGAIQNSDLYFGAKNDFKKFTTATPNSGIMSFDSLAIATPSPAPLNSLLQLFKTPAIPKRGKNDVDVRVICI